MRIGIVLLSIGIGGTEKRLATLFQHLQEHPEHQFFLVAPDRVLKMLRQQGLLSDGVGELYRIDCGRFEGHLERLRWTYYSGFFAWRRALNAALCQTEEDSPVDVFHYAFPISFFIASPRFRHRAVVEAMDSAQSWHIEAMLRWAARRGAIVNCLSAPIRDSLIRGLTSKAARRAYVSPGSIFERPLLAAQEKQRHVAFVGRLETIKNPLLFVEAIARLARNTGDFRVSLLGTGRLEEAVDSRIRELGLDDIVDRTFHERPMEVLADASIFVSLQTMDNYPSQALLEAMACRCAVIASDTGSTERLVTSETGLLVPLDADRIADAMLLLLNDPDRAHRMGVAAQERVQQAHNATLYSAHLEKLYQLAARSDS